LARRSRGRPHETDLPPTESEAPAQARLPSQDEDEGRSSHAGAAPTQGAQPPGGDAIEEVEGAGGRRFRFPRSARVRRDSEIRALYRRGKRRRTDHLDVFVTGSPALRPRLALVVPKHGHKIVERNRLRRRLRESVRLEFMPRCLERGTGIVVLLRARPEAYAVGFDELRDEIRELAEELCLHGS
jgi:ribonuclease P protein component